MDDNTIDKNHEDSFESSSIANQYCKNDAYHIIREKERKLQKYKYLYSATKELYEEILSNKLVKDSDKIPRHSCNEFFSGLIDKIKDDFKSLNIPKETYDQLINVYLTKYDDFIVGQGISNSHVVTGVGEPLSNLDVKRSNQLNNGVKCGGGFADDKSANGNVLGTHPGDLNIGKKNLNSIVVVNKEELFGGGNRNQLDKGSLGVSQGFGGSFADKLYQNN